MDKSFELKVRIAYRAMKLMPNYPTLRGYFGNETFRHPEYVNGSQEFRNEIMQAASQFRYDIEQELPFQMYFRHDLRPFFNSKCVLDLGCLTGGRALAWAMKYETKEIHGIDVAKEYITAATRFSQNFPLESAFAIAVGEALPVADRSYDTIVSYDVFEHVQDIKKVLQECHRTLKVGGHLILVFPSFYQPIEHHLSPVTRTPALQWFFSSQVLMQAYNQILAERGDEAKWYARHCATLEPWEKLNTINGTTLSQFKQMIKGGDWVVVEESYPGLFLTGRLARRSLFFRLISRVLSVFAQIPGLQQDIFADRGVYILKCTS